MVLLPVMTSYIEIGVSRIWDIVIPMSRRCLAFTGPQLHRIRYPDNLFLKKL
jgi:hypothetical protein